jgi:hypothetical protein
MYCESPLAVWLIVNASINITAASFMFTRGRLVASQGGQPLEGGLKAVVTVSSTSSLHLPEMNGD